MMNESSLLNKSEGYLGGLLYFVIVLWGRIFPLLIFVSSGNDLIAATFFLVVRGLGQKEASAVTCSAFLHAWLACF